MSNKHIYFGLCIDEEYHHIECTYDDRECTCKVNVYWQKNVAFYKVKYDRDSEPKMIVAYDKMNDGIHVRDGFPFAQIYTEHEKQIENIQNGKL